MGRKSEKEGMSVCVWLIQQKLTQHCKATILQQKVIFKTAASWKVKLAPLGK